MCRKEEERGCTARLPAKIDATDDTRPGMRRVLSKYLISPFTKRAFSPSPGLQRRIYRFVNWSAQKEVEGRPGRKREKERERERESGTRLRNVTGLWQNAVGERQRFFGAFLLSFLPSPLSFFLPTVFPCFSFLFCWKGVPPDGR